MKPGIFLACAFVLAPSLLLAGHRADKADFILFLDSITPQVAEKGITLDWYEKMKGRIEFLPEVIFIDRLQKKQRARAYSEYMERWLRVAGHPNETRITLGKKLLVKHRALLDRIEQKYKVDRTVIVALWGTETQYGNYMGKYRVLDALATLAYEGRRRRFFTGEFLSALGILRGGPISYNKFVGSWAGAMGQCQFMPTSFDFYAVDFDEDGKRDIWGNVSDILGSIAHYLKTAGWQWQESIAHDQPDTTVAPGEIRLPNEGSPVIYADINYRPLIRWNASDDFVFKVFFLKSHFSGSGERLGK
jgi:membrane-bound lytic murein transglycosylase B